MDGLKLRDAAVAERFRRDGFAIVDHLADAPTTDSLRSAYNELIEGRASPLPGDRMLGGITRQIMMPHALHPLFRDNPALDAARLIARDLVESDTPEFFFSMLIYKPPGHPHETPWHQDMAYAGRPVLPAGSQLPNSAVAQFWLALDDVDTTMGCMEFAAGSQALPMPEHVVAAGDPDDDGRLLAIRDPATAIDPVRVVVCPLQAGSATVHGYATPHRTGPNRSPRPRRAYIFSFANPAFYREALARQAKSL